MSSIAHARAIREKQDSKERRRVRKLQTSDHRPRYGWCADVDSDPEIVWDRRGSKSGLTKPEDRIPVVVIPLPFGRTPNMHRKIALFVNGILWPEIE
jgi:hypothetical protein